MLLTHELRSRLAFFILAYPVPVSSRFCTRHN